MIHFKTEVLAADFDETLPGVVKIVQDDRYSVIVRVGNAFDNFKVLKAVIKSQKRRKIAQKE